LGGGCADHGTKSTVQAQQCTKGTAAAPERNLAELQTEAAASWIADR